MKCKHCKMTIDIRNPSGFCDHLYYPEYCKVCSKKSEKPKVIIEVQGGVAYIKSCPPEVEAEIHDFDCENPPSFCKKEGREVGIVKGGGHYHVERV